MTKKTHQTFKATLYIAAAAVSVWFFVAINTGPASAAPARVTTEQLTAAGFTGVAAVAPSSTRFLAPVYYFKVKQTVLPQAGWGDASNLVSVLIRAKLDAAWQYNEGQIEVRDINGRTQARVSTAANYIVVTGPDQQKVAILAHDLSVAD